MSSNHTNETRTIIQPRIVNTPRVAFWKDMPPPTPQQRIAELLDDMQKSGVSAHEHKELMREFDRLLYAGMTPKDRVRLIEKMFSDALEKGADKSTLKRLHQDLRESENWLKRYTRRNRAPLNFELSSDIAEQEPPQWLVEEILPVEGVGSLYGPSGTYKSFLLLDLLATLSGAASGTEWFGKKVQTAACFYIPLEGRSGVAKRLKAWESLNRRESAVFVMRNPVNLLEEGDREELIAMIRESGDDHRKVLAIDTLAQMGGDMDENSSQGMGAMVAVLQELQTRIPNCLIIVVHHSGKDASKGLRGWSGLHGALDFILKCELAKDGPMFRVEKAKDGETGQSYGFTPITVALEYESGERSSSLAIVPRQRPENDNGSATSPGEIVLQAIRVHGPISGRKLWELLKGKGVRKHEMEAGILPGLLANNFVQHTEKGLVARTVPQAERPSSQATAP